MAGEQVGVTRATALIPEASWGPKQSGRTADGTLDLRSISPSPFDQGQARVGRAVPNCAGRSRNTTRWACRFAPTARAVYERLQGAQDRALYYRDILLPLRERIVNEAQLQYNAMQLGVIDLLRTREQQIQAAIAYY